MDIRSCSNYEGNKHPEHVFAENRQDFITEGQIHSYAYSIIDEYIKTDIICTGDLESHSLWSFVALDM
jgi:hypothetical protein